MIHSMIVKRSAAEKILDLPDTMPRKLSSVEDGINYLKELWELAEKEGNEAVLKELEEKLEDIKSKIKKEEEERMAIARKQAEEYWGERRKREAYVAQVNSAPIKKNVEVKPAPTYTSTTSTASSDSDDGFLTGMLVGAVVNSMVIGPESIIV